MKLQDIVGRLRGCKASLCFTNDKGQDQRRSFDQLHDDTLAIAERLKSAGVVAGCRIGIAAPSHYEWMVWDLACLSMGCVSVALPNDRPQQTWAAIIEAYRLTLLAVEPGWLQADGDTTARPGCVLDLALDAPWSGERLQALPIEHAPGTHSLVFSSGTTGKTKGLVISAPGTERLLDLYHAAFGVVEGERFLTFLPFANYQQRMVYYFCLYHGVDFVSVPFQQLFSGLKRHHPTFLIAPPILYESLQALTLASAGPQAAQDRAAQAAKLAELTGGRIRYMITGMAPIKRAVLDFYWDRGVALYEAFGITEAGMVAWNKPGAVRVGSVGQPAEAGSVSLTEEGEVVVTRDALLSLGYFESSEEDARSTFVGSHSVATGDIAEFDADGFLRIVGRKKDAIIAANGEKFHPEPIESLIQADPRVGVAVVMAGPGPGLVAVISTKLCQDPQATHSLRSHVTAINEGLPAQQQVKRVVFTELDFGVENGLRTKNLKLDRRAIAARFLSAP
jgi:long-chain acyl-CoA synthetase